LLCDLQLRVVNWQVTPLTAALRIPWHTDSAGCTASEVLQGELEGSGRGPSPQRAIPMEKGHTKGRGSYRYVGRERIPL